MLQGLWYGSSHRREILRHELCAGLAGVLMAQTADVGGLGFFTGFTEDLISHGQIMA
jgi:hypothetical protein